MEKIEEDYKRIEEIINEMIPVKWDKVWMYAEIIDDSSEVNFYFCNPGNEELIYGHDISEMYSVSNSIYKELLLKLLHSFEDLKKKYVNSGFEEWSTAILKMEQQGKFSIEYGYENIYSIGINGDQRIAVWEYETFGFLPDDEEDKEAVLNYIKNKEEKNNS
ncbi:antitoxin YezG family protein [Bacillus safensis]|uniref:immunity protein YezG family protein n=1 Tax=Bacillus safensis TaxID=561879 RepID=UPI00203CDC31|nr:immunity protein YezG family protein [Bacillus safensis]MCM2988257.1 antitoxin YezG family protein [Bacillus safensis]